MAEEPLDKSDGSFLNKKQTKQQRLYTELCQCHCFVHSYARKETYKDPWVY